MLLQPSGQPAFILTPIKKHIFKVDSVDLNVEFQPGEGKATMTQAGETYLFTK